jgi:hypothetical protein
MTLDEEAFKRELEWASNREKRALRGLWLGMAGYSNEEIKKICKDEAVQI